MLNTPFDIPKEIKTKPKMLGLEVKELLVLSIVALATITFLKDMVHSFFVIPFYISVGFLCLYLLLPSLSNPNKKNYHSIYMFVKRNKSHYYPIDINTIENQELYEFIKQENKELFQSQMKEEQTIEEKEKTVEEILIKDYMEEGGDFKEFEPEEEPKLVLSPSSNQMTLESGRSLEVNKNKEINDDVKEVKSIAQETVMKQDLNEENKKTNVVEESTNDELNNEPNDEINKKEKIEEESKQKAPFKKKSKKPKKTKTKKEPFKKGYVAIIISAFLLISAFSFFVFNPLNINYSLGEASEDEKQEELLVSALRDFSLKNYDDSNKSFDEINYNSLEDDDKDVMLLSYLFGDKPEKAIDLEPDFDEVAISYYKAGFDMQKLRDLSEKVDSDPMKFEIAISDDDNETILKLKDSVKIKDDRGSIIVNAFLEKGEIDPAKEFVDNINDEEMKKELSSIIAEFEKEKKAKDKKKKKDKK